MKRTYQFEIRKSPDTLNISYETEQKDGIVSFYIHVTGGRKEIFSPVTCAVTVPSWGVQTVWTPKCNLVKALNPDWFRYLYKTNGFTGAPIQCLIDHKGQNCAALGISDTLNTFEFRLMPVEETGAYEFIIKMFEEDRTARTAYDVTLRLDLRELPYYEILADMARWWEKFGSSTLSIPSLEWYSRPVCGRPGDWKDAAGNKPAYVPEAALEPMYSTWYSFHQMVEEKALLTQCRLSAELGCRTLLLDDGWQTEDQSRGYAYCGDWRPAASKIPDIAAFVEKVHALGMKTVVWYSLPFIGERSQNFERFSDMLIDPEAEREWHVLDPRYPEVRNFIISLFENALADWDVDGFKMDFIDEFVVTPFSGRENDGRRDSASFHEAAEYLMKECIARLKARKPEILLEFRQTYNGPLMRSYGNIFRAVDCPFDAVENRTRVTDIRLLCGGSAVHSDMLMWHTEDSTENAALQIINVLFSVPQVSMRLETLPEEHGNMLHFYCSLWKAYKDAFINGSFKPLYPESRYSVISGSYGEKFACVWFGREVIRMDLLYEDMIFVNGSPEEMLYLECKSGEASLKLVVFDCRGKPLRNEAVRLSQGVNCIPVPLSGAVRLGKEISGIILEDAAIEYRG